MPRIIANTGGYPIPIFDANQSVASGKMPNNAQHKPIKNHMTANRPCKRSFLTNQMIAPHNNRPIMGDASW